MCVNYLFCFRHCVQCHVLVVLLNNHKSLMRWEWLTSQLYKWVNWGLEAFSNLPQVTHPGVNIEDLQRPLCLEHLYELCVQPHELHPPSGRSWLCMATVKVVVVKLSVRGDWHYLLTHGKLPVFVNQKVSKPHRTITLMCEFPWGERKADKVTVEWISQVSLHNDPDISHTSIGVTTKRKAKATNLAGLKDRHWCHKKWVGQRPVTWVWQDLKHRLFRHLSMHYGFNMDHYDKDTCSKNDNF